MNDRSGQPQIKKLRSVFLDEDMDEILRQTAFRLNVKIGDLLRTYIERGLNEDRPLPMEKKEPVTVIACGECGATAQRFEKETFSVRHQVGVQNLSGWRCDECQEIEFDPESAIRYAEAGDNL